MDSGDIPGSLAKVRRAVEDACREAGRETGSVTLVAVSKTVASTAIEAAIAAGQRVFGENRVQEAKRKWADLTARHQGLDLHLVGALQTNKARDAVALFGTIHSLDRTQLAEALARESDRQHRRPRVFVQVNTGAEPQKSGVLPANAGELVTYARDICGLDVTGLMCVPPAAGPPDQHFALLAELAAANGLAALSMGMSADYGAAIRCGATHVRMGTAIFGQRPM